MKAYCADVPRGYLRQLLDLCTGINILLIVDEVATGFTRTSKMFACEYDAFYADYDAYKT